MKLLDCTLITLLATIAPAAWAQSPAGASAADQTVLKLRSEGEAGSVDDSPEGLQAFRRVDISHVKPGALPVSGKFSVNLPSGGLIWATEDPKPATPVLNVQAASMVALSDGKIAEPVQFHTYSNYAAFAKSFELLIYRGSDTDLAEALVTVPVAVGNVGQAVWDGVVPAGVRLRDGDELQYVLRAISPEGHVDETMPNRLQMVRPQDVQRSLQQLVSTSVGVVKGLTALQMRARDLQAGIYGLSNLRQQNIPVFGSTVRVIGQEMLDGLPLRINGQNIPIDHEGKFAAEYLLPVGRHSFDIEAGTGVQAINRKLDIDVSGDYFFMVGLADLTLSGNSVSGPVSPVGLADRYDEVLTEGRLAFYLKGKVKGKYLITAQADTSEREISQLFSGFLEPDARDIFRRLDPDQYYPVYGDDSTSFRDIDTQGRMYVRVDWDKSQAIWGNFSTGMTGSEYSQYIRSLYGAAVSWRSAQATSQGQPKYSLRAFGSEAQSAPGHSEFLGTGGSLYYLRHSDLLPGSDKVFVELQNPLTGRVESRTELVRGIDYQIDELQGRVTLTRPLAQVVRDDLPTITRDQPRDGFDNRLMVDYEYLPTGFNADQVTAGFSGKAWLGDRFAIGGTYVDENRIGEDYQLRSVDLTYQVGRGSYLRIEQAETSASSASVFYSDNGGLSFSEAGASEAASGEATSVEARINMKELGWTANEWTAAAWWRDIDPGFSVARFSRGYEIQDQGLEFTAQFTDSLRVSGRYSDAQRDGESLEQAQVLVEWRVGEHDRLIAEFRRVTETRFSGQGTGTLVALQYNQRFGGIIDLYGIAQFTVDDDGGAYQENDAYTIGARYLFGNLSSFGVEYSDGDRGNSTTFTSDYQMSPLHALYAAYANSTDTTAGDPLFSTRKPSGLTLGQRWRISDQINLFNESQFLKARTESGIAHTFGMDFHPRQGWNLGFTLLKGDLDSLDGVVERRGVSINVGHTDMRAQWNSKLEYREDSGAEDRTQWLSTNRMMYRLNRDWRLAGRLNWSQTEDRLDPAGDAKFVEANVGFAYRPVLNDRLSLLGKFAYLHDLGSLGQDSLSEYDQRSQILSIEGIYRLSKAWEVAGKLAHRHGEARMARDAGDWYDSTANFAAVQGRYGLAYQWDALAEYRWLDVEENDSTRQGWLVGVDRQVGDNFRVGLGYNFTSFSDDLAELDYDHKGWFLNLSGTY